MSEPGMPKRAVILAGGRGARLRPYTVVLPKPLMPIGDYPILEVIIRQLARYGFERITMAVNHQANLIKAFFGDGSPWGLAIDYSLESEPLSTIAPLALIPDLPQHFLLMNGDVLTDLNFQEFFEDHVRQNRLFTIAAALRRQVSDYGVLRVKDGLLSGFEEKPETGYQVAMGVQMVRGDVLELIPPGRKFGFDDLMYRMLERKLPVHIRLHVGYWKDIGRPDDYMQAIEDFEARRDALLNG
jgi:NDP-sugar pyrophosphorylase family protein